MRTLTYRMGRISIVGSSEEVTMGKEIGRGEGVGKFDLLGDRVCYGN